MRLIVCSVFDTAVGAFAPPFFCQALGQASRVFGDWVNDPATPLSRHPGDYRLYHLGSWEDQTGDFMPLEPAVIANGADFVAPKGGS
jgi:hypothetical protein